MISNFSVIIFSFLSFLVVSACGFQPVYQAEKNNSETTALLSSIAIDPLPGRQGQILHSSLEDLLNPLSKSGAKDYRLVITLSENEFPVAIEKSGQITRYNIEFTASYTLIDTKTNKPVDKGIVKTVGSYDAVDLRYSTFTAKSYTIKTTLKELSEDIKIRLIAALYR